jgi:hypothetical protein
MDPFDTAGENDSSLKAFSDKKAAALRLMMASATSTDPKQHATDMNIARRLAVPPEIVSNLPPEDKKFAPAIDYRALAENYPKTSEYLLNPNHAKISQNDIESMMTVERTLKEFDPQEQGLFDKKTRSQIVDYLRQEGYEVDIAPSDEIQRRRSRAFTAQNMSWFEQFGAAFSGQTLYADEKSQSESMRELAKAMNAPTEQRVELPTDPRGWTDSISQSFEKAKMIPYVASAGDAEGLVRFKQIANRAEAGKMTTDDWAFLLKQDNEVRRGSSRGARVTDILMQLPAFAGEIGTSMGVGTAASAAAKAGFKGTMLGLRKSLSKSFSATAAKKMMRSGTYRAGSSLISGATRVAAMTATGGAARVAVETFRKQLPQFKGLTDEQADAEAVKLNAVFKETEQSFLQSLARSYGEQYIEIGTEMLGFRISKGYEKLFEAVGVTGFMSAIAARYLKFNPTKTLSQFRKELGLQNVGWDGPLTEWTEERIGGLTRVILGWEKAGIDTEQWIDEAIAFAITGGISYAPAIVSSYRNAVDAAAYAQAQVEHVQALANGVANTETPQLVPNLQALQAQMAAEGGPVSTVYFPIDAWTQYWESVGQSPRQQAINLGVDERAYDQLVLDGKGQDLPIEIGKYIEFLIPTEHGQPLSEVVRFGENSPNVSELRQVVQEQMQTHGTLTGLMQSRARLEQDQEKLKEETEKLKAQLAELVQNIATVATPEAVAALQAGVDAAATDEEKAKAQESLAAVAALPAQAQEVRDKLLENTEKIKELNAQLSELRKQELAFSQANISEAPETKALADKIFEELQAAFAPINSTLTKTKQIKESTLRLNAAMSARMVATLADRAGISVPEFTERFALRFTGSGVVVPVGRSQLTQSRVSRYEVDYRRAIDANDMPAAQRIVDGVAAVAGIAGPLNPIAFNENGQIQTLAERFGVQAVRKYTSMEVKATYQGFTYSQEMMVGNNTGSVLAPMINAPLWVKMQFDSEVRTAYQEPGTGSDLLADAFGLTQAESTVAPSAYVNQSGSLEINPSGQLVLKPRASAEFEDDNWNAQIEGTREVLPNETIRSIVEDGLYPQIRAAREAVEKAKADVKAQPKDRKKEAKEALATLEASLAQLEESLNPAIKKGIKTLVKRNEIDSPKMREVRNAIAKASAELEQKRPEDKEAKKAIKAQIASLEQSLLELESSFKPKGTIIFLTRSSARLRAYALAHGIIQQQEAVSGHVAIPLSDNATDAEKQAAPGISVSYGRPLNEMEIQILFTEAKRILGANQASNIGYFPTPTGYKLVNFGVSQSLYLDWINRLHSLNLILPSQICFFNLNWDLGIYETNTRTAAGTSNFEEKLRQSGFWSEFVAVRDRIEPRLRSLTTLWKARADIAQSSGGISTDTAWQSALQQTGGTVNISRSPLAGTPVLTISSAQDISTLMAGFMQQNPNAKPEEIADAQAKLIRLDAYQAVENQEQAEGRVRADERKKRVELLAQVALSKIQGMDFLPEAIRLSMADISIGKAGEQQKMEGVMQFLIWAENQIGDAIGKSDPSTLTGQEKEKVADALYYFTLARLAAKQASGVDWYLAAVQASMAIVHNIHPELRNNRDLERLYKALIAVTSQGQRVEQNFVFADVVYRFYQQNGRLPDLVTFGGKSRGQIQNNLVKLQNLINSRGLAAAMDLLGERMQTKEVDALLSEVLPEVAAAGKKKNLVAGELGQTIVRGAMMLGPKIGSFFGNLQFLFDSVTMDLWFTRTIQRILGRPFGITVGDQKDNGTYTGLKGSLDRLLGAMRQKEKAAKAATAEQRKALSQALADARKASKDASEVKKKLTDEEKKKLKRAEYYAEYALAEIEWTNEDKAVVKELENFLKTPSANIGDRQTQIAPMLARTLAYSGEVHRRFGADGYVLKTEFNRAAKTIDEDLTKGQEAPTSGEYRNAVREIIDILRTRLKADGIDLENADLQAVLWYGEKDLYWMFGVADAAEGQDYAYSAAHLYAEKLMNNQRPHQQMVGHTSIPGDIARFSQKADASAEIESDDSIETVALQQRTKRTRDPILQQAAIDMQEGRLTPAEYQEIVRTRAPMGEFTEVPVPATNEEMAYGLGERPLRAGEPTLKRDLIIAPESIGRRIVESRLDIPAYDERGIWIVSLHDDTGPLREDFRKAGPILGYAAAVHLRGVQFRSSQKASLKIAAGAPKSTIATMRGENVTQSVDVTYQMAQQAMNDPEWVEVGFNPIRSSMFYRKDTGAPVTDAAEVLQVGGMVLAKNPVADDSVVRLYQLVWHYSTELFDKFTAHHSSDTGGLGWGLLFSDSKQMAELYGQLKAADKSAKDRRYIEYSVNIPETDQLLNIDGKFDDQSEHVKNAFLNAKLNASSRGIDQATEIIIRQFISGTITGRTLIDKLAGKDDVMYLNMAGISVEAAARQASMTLKAMGIPGRVATVKRNLKTSQEFLIWDDVAVAVANRIEDQGNFVKGQLTFYPKERGNPSRKFTIELFKSADVATIMHEMMHYYLEALGDLAASDSATDEVKAEMETVVKWWQRRPALIRKMAAQLADSGSIPSELYAAKLIRSMSDDEIVNALAHWRKKTAFHMYIGFAGHELLAENWEAYLREGKAPIQELQSMFQRFKKWIGDIYKTIASIGKFDDSDVSLSDDIVGFFDKVVATETEIKAAEEREQVEPMFASKPDKMPEAVWNEYSKFIGKASEKARELLGEEIMRSERALLRKQRAAYREQREKEVRAELEGRQDYIALYVLRTGRTPDGKELQPPLQAFKLDKASLQGIYWRSADKDKMKRLRELGVYSTENGVTPDQAAEIFGFASGEELLNTLLNIRPLADVVKERVKADVDAMFGSMLDNPEALAEAASEAVRNEFREDVIAIEMAELQRLIRADKKAMRRILNSAPRPLGVIAARIIAGTENQANAAISLLGSYKLLKQLAEQQAARMLGRMRLRDIRPGTYAAAAKRNAQAATRFAARGEYIQALSAKEAELANTALHRMAVEVRKNADKQADWLESRNKESAQAKLGLAGGSFQDQMNALLERFNFRPIPLVEVDRRVKLREWIESQKSQGYTVDVSQNILDEAYRKDFRDMTPGELKDVFDLAKQIYHLAKEALEIKVGEEKREFKEMIQILTATISGNRKPKPRPIGALNKSEKLAARIAGQFGSMRKLASLIRELDGFNEAGPMYWAFMDPINQAGNNEAALREDALLRLKKVFAVFTKQEMSEMATRRDIVVNGKSFSLSREDVLCMALNWGNESSRQRLVDGNNAWVQADVEAILATLSKRDWDFVQSVWDLIHSYWADISAKQRRVYGIAPEPVEPAMVTTAFGVYRGGYYPIEYRGLSSQFATDDDAAESMKAGSVSAATTKRGFLIERLDRVEREVRLGFDVIHRHLNAVIHDITHHEMLIQTGRILRDRNVAAAIETYYGQDTLYTINSLLKQIAIGDTHGTEHGSMLYKFLRNGTQISIMGYNLMTSMQQVFGLTQSVTRVGAIPLLKAAMRWLTSASKAENTVAWVHSKSTLMRLRAKTQDRELNEIYNTITPDARKEIQSTFYYLIIKGQQLADMPTWLAAYDNAINEGMSDDNAVTLADQAIIDTQGSGMIKDLALAQQGSAFQRLFTLFYSYAITTYNLNVETIKGIEVKGKGQIGRAMVDLLILNSLPVALTLLVNSLLGRYGEDEDLLKKLAKDQFAFLLNQSLFTREFIGILEQRGYEGPAGIRPIGDVYRLANAITSSVKNEEMSRTAWVELNRVAGVLFHYPAIQLQRTVEGAKALWEGNTRNPLVLLRGPTKEERE